MKRFAWMVVAGLLVVMAAVQDATAQQRRAALVIGNGTYAAGGNAPSAEANARAVGEALRAAGFEVTVATDLTRAAMAETIGRFQEKLAGSDLGLFYYSGLMLAMDGRSHMVPVDARLASEFDVVFETVPLEPTLERVRQAAPRAVAVIDPIVPNPFVERLAAVTGAAGRSLRPMPDAPPPAGGLLVAFSHQPGRTPVLVGGSGPGTYAAALAEAFRRPGIELRQALATAEGHVSQQSGGRQLPWVQGGLDGPVVLGPAAPPPVAETLPPTAVDPMAENQVAVRDTNVRAGPGMEAPVLRAVRQGTTVGVTGRVRGSSWLRVTVEGQTGYIVARNLAAPDAVPPPEEAPVATAPEAEPEPAAGPVAPGVYALSRPATLFAQPVLGARGLGELQAGQLVTVTGSVPGTNWVLARDRFGQEGYVGAGALTSIWGAVSEGRSDDGVPASGGGQSSGDGRAVVAQPLPEPPAATVAAAPSAAGGAVRDAVAAARGIAGRASQTADRARNTAEEARRAEERARAAAERARTGYTGGVAVQRLVNGEVYEGEIGRAGQKDGYGVYRFADGQVYAGQWRANAMTGSAAFAFANGDRYEGNFRNGVPAGLGVFRFANGEAYAGEVRDGEVVGLGELTFTDGAVYAGQVRRRLPDGDGALRWTSGARHVGRFVRGLPQGPGEAVARDGATRTGVWQGSTVIEE